MKPSGSTSVSDASIARLLVTSARAGSAATSIMLCEATVNEIAGHMHACLPREGVGLLAATQVGDALRVSRFLPGVNVAAAATRFSLHPYEVAHLLSEILANGDLLGAVVHSHPTGPATPSRLDIAEATMDGVLHLIVQLEPMLQLRAWRIGNGTIRCDAAVQEVPVIAKRGDSDKLSGDSLRIQRSLDLSDLRS